MKSKREFRILAVDDDPDIRELLQYNLNKEGYTVTLATNGKEAMDMVKKEVPHLVLLDIMMPEMDGIETCRQMREIPEMENTFIIFLTARAEEYSEVAAFDSGADDFITKPVKQRALASRILNYFKRERKSASQGSELLKYGNLTIDRDSYTVYMAEEKIPMARKEFELLSYLAANPEKVFSRDDLLYAVWGVDVYVLARTVDVHVRKIREKIGGQHIVTVKGVGYKFTAHPDHVL